MLKTPDFSLIISSVMNNLSKDDCDGALPYLMLTSKCEHVFRDLLAIRMRRNLQKPNVKQCYEVAREKTFGKKKKKRKVDIAIFQLMAKTFRDPVAFLELKYVARPTTVIKFCKELKSELEEAKKAKANVKLYSGAAPSYLGLLLVREARTVRSDSADGLAEIIGKYKPLSHQQEIKLPRKYDEVRHKATSLGLEIPFESQSPIFLGKDLGCEVKLQWWLFSL